MIFLFPLVLSIVAAGMFVLGDYSIATKAVTVLIAATAAALQFIPALAEQVHFLVPLFMQLILCGWWYIAFQLE